MIYGEFFIQLHTTTAPSLRGAKLRQIYLVGGLEHFLFSHILGIILPIDFHIFQRGGPTTNQKSAGDFLFTGIAG